MGDVIPFRRKEEKNAVVVPPMRMEWMMPAFFDVTFYESSLGFVDTAPSEMPPESA